MVINAARGSAIFFDFKQEIICLGEPSKNHNETQAERAETEHRKKKFKHFVVHGVHYAN